VDGYSAGDLSQNVLTGRPYGGTGILYEKLLNLSHCIKFVDTYYHCITALVLTATSAYCFRLLWQPDVLSNALLRLYFLLAVVSNCS